MGSRRIMIGIAATAAAAAAMAVVAASPAQASVSSVLITTNNPATPVSTSGNVSFRAIPGTGTNTTQAVVRLRDLRSGTVLTCAATTPTYIDGTFKRGTTTGSGSINVGTIPGATTNSSSTNNFGIHFGTATWVGNVDGTSGTFTPGSNPCLAASGVPVAVVPCTGGWNVNVTNQSTGSPFPPSNPAANQTTPGSITNICASVYVRGSATSACHFDVSGANGPTGTALPRTTPTSGTGTVTGSYQNTTARGTLSIPSPGGQVLAARNQTNPSTGCVGGAIVNGDSFVFEGSGNGTTATFGVGATSSGATDAIWINAAP